VICFNGSVKPLRRLVTWTTVPLLVIVATLAVAAPARAAPACQLSWRFVTSWPASEGQLAGFVGDFTVTNIGDTTSRSWQLDIRWPAGTALASWWNAERVEGTFYKFDSYPGNGVLGPGESVIVGVSARELLAWNPNRPRSSSCEIS
jgi:hypothetical protein